VFRRTGQLGARVGERCYVAWRREDEAEGFVVEGMVAEFPNGGVLARRGGSAVRSIGPGQLFRVFFTENVLGFEDGKWVRIRQIDEWGQYLAGQSPKFWLWGGARCVCHGYAWDRPRVGTTNDGPRPPAHLLPSSPR
jgi:hypothetical protein